MQNQATLLNHTCNAEYFWENGYIIYMRRGKGRLLTADGRIVFHV